MKIKIVSFLFVIIFLLICALIIFSVWYFSYKAYKKYCDKNFPSILSDLRRNYESLILGNRALPNIEKNDNSKDFTNYYRNYYTDILILQRYYSLIKDNGIVLMYIDCSDENYFHSNKVSSFDYSYLHPVTLIELNYNAQGFRYKLNKFLNGFRFAFVRWGQYKKNEKRMCSIHVIEKWIENELPSAIIFCKERGLHLNLKMFSSNEVIQKKVNDILKEYK